MNITIRLKYHKLIELFYSAKKLLTHTDQYERNPENRKLWIFLSRILPDIESNRLTRGKYSIHAYIPGYDVLVHFDLYQVIEIRSRKYEEFPDYFQFYIPPTITEKLINRQLNVAEIKEDKEWIIQYSKNQITMMSEDESFFEVRPIKELHVCPMDHIYIECSHEDDQPYTSYSIKTRHRKIIESISDNNEFFHTFLNNQHIPDYKKLPINRFNGGSENVYLRNRRNPETGENERYLEIHTFNPRLTIFITPFMPY